MLTLKPLKWCLAKYTLQTFSLHLHTFTWQRRYSSIFNEYLSGFEPGLLGSISPQGQPACHHLSPPGSLKAVGAFDSHGAIKSGIFFSKLEANLELVLNSFFLFLNQERPINKSHQENEKNAAYADCVKKDRIESNVGFLAGGGTGPKFLSPF